MTTSLIIFDLDGTLAESKSEMTYEMCELLSKLLEIYSMAVISGGAWPQFEKQFLKNLLLEDEQQKRLFLFPTCATSFYRYQNKKWTCVYSEDLSVDEKKLILEAFQKCFKEVNFEVLKIPMYGEILEDRQTQITFSALGQNAPVNLKKKWDPNHLKRLKMIEILHRLLPDFEIRSGGTTSIDVTRKNIDKAYGIRQITQHLGFTVSEMLFIGDAIFPGGNDYAVKSTGVKCLETSGPQQTMEIISNLLDNPA